MNRPLIALLTLAGAFAALGATPAKTPVNQRNEPIQVTAETMVSDLAAGKTVFERNVVIVQGAVTIRADKVDVFSPPQASSGGSPVEGGQDVSRIVATGNVSFHQKPAEGRREINTTGDNGVYDRETDTVTMTGKPKLWQGKNWVTGETMIFHLGTDLYEVIGGAGSETKIKAVFYPQPKGTPGAGPSPTPGK